MDEQQVLHFLAELFSDLSAESLGTELDWQAILYLDSAANPKRPALADAVLMYSTEQFCDNVYIN
jgi:hypothetical protein